MSMDALTAAAFDSLHKDVLPRLSQALARLAKLSPDQRAADPEIIALATEARELLSLLSSWTSAPEVALASGDLGSDELSDEDAALLLMAGGDTSTPAPAPALDDLETMADNGSAKQDEEMSDEEARRLLAAMDEPEEATTAATEISDSEACRLLAEMDAPAPQESADEMSDAEARKLLAEMDAPAAQESSASDGEEMSDEEARALLQEMAAPESQPSRAPAKAPPPQGGMSADDEAMRMLLAMGGGDDVVESPSAPPTAPAPIKENVATPKVNTAAAPHPMDPAAKAMDEGEIVEFEKNDFRSDPDMMNDFNTNTGELLETLDATILQLEQNPRDKETIESIFRAAHTLKGAAGMFGFKAIERVMHRMEHLFDQVRKGVLVPDASTIDVVLQGMDVLRGLLKGAETGQPTFVKTGPIVSALTLAASGKYVRGSLGQAAKSSSESEATVEAAPPAQPAEPSVDGGDHGRVGGSAVAKKSGEQSTIRVDLERLDALVNLVGELVIDRTRFSTIEESIRTSSPQLSVASNMTETVQLFGRHMNEIHEIIMKIRMVPIGNAFNKFSRIVRDLSRQLNKDIELVIDGEDTELDKTLVEQIGDPLIHLIRNSCDHGVEMPDVREASGKARGGKIFLSARQEGNNIIITIEDDGKGIPADIVRKKAIERGLITEDMAMSKRDIFNLIFEPGFSTADKVTTISGRGVGMDVVRRQISRLKGVIDIDSEQGKGTTITIRLPLTLAIVQSLLVEASGENFAIPLAAVVESVRIKPDEIQRVGDAEVIKRHGQVLPLMHLSEALDLSKRANFSWYSLAESPEEARHRAQRRKERLYVVIVGSGERRFGIVVDSLLNQQEMVIKSLGPIMKNVPCVAGGAVLGNGAVVLVLDIQELEDRSRSRAREAAAA